MFLFFFFFFFFFFNDTATTEIYTLSLHDALPILVRPRARAAADARIGQRQAGRRGRLVVRRRVPACRAVLADPEPGARADRCRGGTWRALGRSRAGLLGPTPPAGHRATRARRTRARAQLLAARRMDPVLAGFRRPVGS